MKIWQIRAGEDGKHWDAWNEKSIISIGWDIGELERLTKEEMKKRIEDEYPTYDSARVAGFLRTFAGLRDDQERNMEKGDVAIVFGPATVLDVADIKEYKYEKDGLREGSTHMYWRNVDYHDSGPVRIRDLPEKFQQGGEFSLHLPCTLQRFSGTEENLNELIESMGEVEKIDLTKEGFLDFKELEIQRYIKNNFNEIWKELKLVDDEYPTSVGDADFVASDGKKTVVIEVKMGTAKDDAIGQLLGYMNAIRDKEKKDVYGMLIAEDFSPRVKMAAKSDDVKLKKFRAKLEFSDVE